VTSMDRQTRRLGNMDVVFPGHMNVLSQEGIDCVLSAGDPNLRIIACGIDPSDRQLSIFTGTCDLMSYDPKGWETCKFVPTKSGAYIDMYVSEDKAIPVPSALVIEQSQNCLKTATLRVNDTYLCDIDISSAQAVDP